MLDGAEALPFPQVAARCDKPVHSVPVGASDVVPTPSPLPVTNSSWSHCRAGMGRDQQQSPPCMFMQAFALRLLMLGFVSAQTTAVIHRQQHLYGAGMAAARTTVTLLVVLLRRRTKSYLGLVRRLGQLALRKTACPPRSTRLRVRS